MTVALRVATRGSALARAQTDRIVATLGVPAEPVIISTRGDQDRTSPIHSIGGTGVFVKEVQAAVLDGRADLAVHSAKDLPALPVDGLVIGAFPEREDPRDALVGATLVGLRAGATVATGSVRRRAQLANLRPDLTFAELRGNIGTRVERAADFDAVVVAFAALKRLDLVARADEVLGPATMLPQVGQGALAVECRAADTEMIERLAPINDLKTRAEVEAERAYLAVLGSGCDLPVGALAHRSDDGPIALEALLASPDGHVVLRATVNHHDPVAAGKAAAAELLERAGGERLLADAGLAP